MRDRLWQALIRVWILVGVSGSAWAQQTLQCEQVEPQFGASDSVLFAGCGGAQESQAREITPSLRPNPEILFFLAQPYRLTPKPCQPFANALLPTAGKHGPVHPRPYAGRGGPNQLNPWGLREVIQ